MVRLTRVEHFVRSDSLSGTARFSRHRLPATTSGGAMRGSAPRVESRGKHNPRG